MNRIDLAQLLANPEAVIRRVIATGEPTEIRVEDSTVRLRAIDPQTPQGLIEAAHEARQTLDSIEDVAPDDMSTMFYIHAYNELTLGLRTLLEAVDEQTGDSAEPSLGPAEIHGLVRVLSANLGPTIVQTIAGTNEASMPGEWARPGGPTPPADVQRKLRLAHQVWSTIAHAQGADVALAWMVGASPRLGGDLPLQYVIDERADEVLGAALAYAQDDGGT